MDNENKKQSSKEIKKTKDKHLSLDEYDKLDEENVPYAVLPPGTLKLIKEFITSLTNDEKLNDLTEDQQKTLADIISSTNGIDIKDVGSRTPLEDTLTDKPEINNKKLVLKSLTPKIKSNSFSSVKLKLTSGLGIGTPIHIPLWHSGFWITINPLLNSEKINLQLALGEETDRIGRYTHSLIYSNYSVIYAKIIMDMIKSKIIDTSLNLDDNDNIFDYISIEDLDIIIWGLLKSIHPEGFNYILYCKNSIRLNEDEIPKCNFRKKENLDLNTLLRVDITKIPDEHKAIMTKRSSRSVTKEDIEEYKSAIRKEDTIEIKHNDLFVTIDIKSPSISKYLEYGETFIELLRDKALEVLENGGDINIDGGKLIKSEAEAEALIINAIMLQIYAHFINRITVNGTEVKGSNEISEVLEILSNNKKHKNEILSRIIDFIDKSLIAIIGIPDFICPECYSSQSESNNNFRSFIGLDVYNYFFIMLVFQYQKAIEESEID